MSEKHNLTWPFLYGLAVAVLASNETVDSKLKKGTLRVKRTSEKGDHFIVCQIVFLASKFEFKWKRFWFKMVKVRVIENYTGICENNLLSLSKLIDDAGSLFCRRADNETWFYE